MRPLALLVLTAAACGTGIPPEPHRSGHARGAAEVRVATWNVHDLFDDVDRLVPPGELDTVPSEAEVDAKLARVAGVLARVDADVVLLQEVENVGILERLASEAGYPVSRLVEGNDPRGIDVALLSRLPLVVYVSHVHDRGPDGRLLWPRDCVEAHLDASRPLVVVGSHLSSALSDGGTRRAWQAARMRELADAASAADPTAVVLAGGDLNDAPASVALAPLVGDGAWADPAPPGAGTWPSASPSARFDYLLVARASASLVSDAWIEAGADVVAASDHRPLVVDLRLE
jgi:endonuclease/exonuclease/phosphatase family metal-dependent hydrolase